MTDKTEHTLDELAENFVDALSVDWGYAKQLGDDAQDLLKNFHTISQIAQLHHSHHGTDNTDSRHSDTETMQLFQWGRLKVVEKIGSGANGQVYRAHDDILDRDVALKLLKSDDSTPLKAKTFIQEAKRIAKVRHPHVLAVHGANIHDGRAGFWADLINGHSLDQHNKEPYPADELFKLCSQLVHGLAAIHRAGIIHGDIKPANIMQDESGDYLIMDFGAGLESAELQQLQGFVHGTPALMAPEMFNDQHAGFATDVYALGATLFKLATNHYPIETDDLLTIQQAHQKQKYHKIKSHRRDLPVVFSRLIEQMMAADPARRPSTKAIIKTLFEIEQAPQKRRNKLALRAIVVLLLAGTAASLWGFYEANQAKDAAIIAQNKAEEVNEFLQDMMSASSELGGGREVRVADVLDQASDKLFNDPPDDVSVAIEMHQSLADSYNSLRDTEKSKAHAKSSLNLAQSIYPINDERFVNGQLELAHALEISAQHEESIALADQILAAAEPTLGADHWYIQRAKKHKITNLMAMSAFDEAIQLLDQYFPTVPEPQTASNNLGYEILQARANAYSFKGNYEQAIEAAKAGLDWLDQYPKSGLINQEAITSILGAAQLEHGMIDEGIESMTIALELNVLINGKESVDYLDGLVNLGAAQRLQNKPELAAQTTLEAFALAKQIYGEQSNLRTVGIGINLANMLVDLGDLEQGEAVMRESLDVAYQVLGTDKPQALILEYNLAELLNKKGNHAEALEYAISSHSKKQTAFGANHPYVFLTLDNWATSLSGLGQHQQAINKHQEAVTGITAALGAAHQYTLLVRQHQIDTLLAADESVAIEELLPVLVNDLRQTLGADDAGTVKYLKLLNNLKLSADQ